VGVAKSGCGERRGGEAVKKNETPTDEDMSLHPFKTHPKSTPVGAT